MNLYSQIPMVQRIRTVRNVKEVSQYYKYGACCKALEFPSQEITNHQVCASLGYLGAVEGEAKCPTWNLSCCDRYRLRVSDSWLDDCDMALIQWWRRSRYVTFCWSYDSSLTTRISCTHADIRFRDAPTTSKL